MRDVNLDHLREAIALARTAREHGNHPFGALLVDAQGEVVLRAENSVNTESDCTGHAETNLVRLASARFTPAELEHCTLYTSTEPCAMCAAAIHWANIGRVVYALSEVSLYEIIGPSPHHLYLECREVFARSQRPIEVVGPLLEDEARLVQLGFWSDPM
jgi:tRNA(Arg) A34 adenosine deaminase TadA